MKNLTLQEFEASCGFAVSYGVVSRGDVIRVDCGESGAAIVLDEDTYNILYESYKAVFAVAASVNADEKTIDVGTLLDKLGD